MAQIIKIKRSTTTAAPATLAPGELAYSEDSRKLFIGRPNDGTVIDIAGELYTDMLDHAAGALTASSAIIVDANSKIDRLLTGNISITGATDTIATSAGPLTLSATGNLVFQHGSRIDISAQANEFLIPDNQAAAVNFTENGTSYIKIVTTNTLEKVIFGQNSVFEKNVSLASDNVVLSFGASGDITLTHIPDTALRLNGAHGFQFRDADLTIYSSVDGQLDLAADVKVSIVAPTIDLTASTAVNVSNALNVGGAADFNAQVAAASLNVEDLTAGRVTFAAANGELVDSANFTYNSSTGHLAINGSANVDNVNIDGNTISTLDANGDLFLAPNGTGVVKVPTGYKDRANFDANTLVPKSYVDAVKQALDIKDSVLVATTENITLSGTQTIDEVDVVDGDRVLVKNQTNAAENGIYDVVAGASWNRSDDASVSAEVTPGMFVFVEEGTANGDNGFVLTTDGPITLGTTSLTFTQFSGAGQVEAGDGLSKTGNRLDVNDDNITLEISGDNVRIKGIGATAKGDILLGAASNAGYTRLIAPTSGSVTASTYLLSMDTSGNAAWADTLDGGTF